MIYSKYSVVEMEIYLWATSGLATNSLKYMPFLSLLLYVSFGYTQFLLALWWPLIAGLAPPTSLHLQSTGTNHDVMCCIWVVCGVKLPWLYEVLLMAPRVTLRMDLMEDLEIEFNVTVLMVIVCKSLQEQHLLCGWGVLELVVERKLEKRICEWGMHF